MRVTRWLLGLAAIALVLVGGPADASAYPQFQFSTGTAKCSDCHFSPSGGGLINDYGRMEAGDTISRSGNGEFLHGLWTPPDFLQLGGDYRGAAVIKHHDDDTEFLGFPMQADLYARAAVGSVSLNVIGGFRGAARDPRPSFTERLISREHYIMYEKDDSSMYVRAGRFFPVYGLRLVDHTAYVRRFMGFYTFEESYALGLGLRPGQWELHANVFAPVPPEARGAGPGLYGATFYAERSIREETGAVGFQVRGGFADGNVLATVGTVGKLWLESTKILLLGQLDLQLQRIDAGAESVSRGQTALYLGASYFWKPWWLVGLAFESWDPDLVVGGDERDAVDLTMNIFPYAHFELQLLGKLEAQGNQWGAPSSMGMLMLHYYL